VKDAGIFREAGMPFEKCGDRRFIAKHQEFGVRVAHQGQRGAGNGHGRAKIAAHRIQRYSDPRVHLSLSGIVGTTPRGLTHGRGAGEHTACNG
jgi:hypothetical protein